MTKGGIMKITVMNFKGGVGKTSISVNLAMMMGAYIVTNDFYSPLERVLPQNRIMKLKNNDVLPIFPADLSIVFDLGGHIDPRTVDALKQSDVVVIPLFRDFLSLKVSIACIKDVSAFNKNIVIVNNRAEKGDFEQVSRVIGQFYPDLPIFPIKRSKAFENTLKNKKSIKQMVEGGGLDAYNYRLVFEQFCTVAAYIQNKTKEI